MSNKNLTITLTEEEHKELERLMSFYQKNSITRVTKSDVLKHLIKSGSAFIYGHKK